MRYRFLAFLSVVMLFLNSILFSGNLENKVVNDSIDKKVTHSSMKNGVNKKYQNITSYKTWTALINCNWSNDSNWLPIGAPVNGDTVQIPGGLCAPTIPNNFSLDKLIVDSLGIVNISGGTSVSSKNIVNNGTIATAGIISTIKIVGSQSFRVSGSGKITGRFRMVRPIAQGDTGRYFYESPGTYIQFSDTGTFPDTVSMTVYADSLFPVSSEIIPSHVDTVNNLLVADTSLDHFSTIRAGGVIPVVGEIAEVRDGTIFSEPDPIVLKRFYDIEGIGGSGFEYVFSIHYQNSEVPSGRGEDSLQMCLIIYPCGQTKEWTNATANCSWSDSLNWSPPCIPTNGDTVIIPASLCAPTIPNGFQFGKLLVDSLGTVNLSAGSTIYANRILNNGTIAAQTGSLPTIAIIDSQSQRVSGNGKITGRFRMVRPIAQGDTARYQYESAGTYIKFGISGTFPDSVTMTVYSDSLLSLSVDPIPSHVNTAKNYLIADTSWTHFSTIRAGGVIPVVGEINESSHKSSVMTSDPVVLERFYDIEGEGGNSFDYQISIHYENSEVPVGRDEDSLRLFLSGYYVSETLNQSWNIISVPVTPDNYSKTYLFPTASSDAFAFIGGYVEMQTLENGVGYWLKYPSSQIVLIYGEERTIDTINVTAGWNLVGTLSEEFPASSVTSNQSGIIESPFFEYDNGYYPATVLKPMKGYWVKVSSSGVLYLNSSNAQMRK